MQKQKIKKSAFTLIELMIVVGLTGMMAMFGLSTLSHNKLKISYDSASNKILEFMKETRVYGMSNYIKTGSGTTDGGGIVEYKVPKGGYGFQIEKGVGTGVVALKIFYNNDEDVKFSSGTDILIKEFISGPNSIYFEKIYGTGSELAYPAGNSTGAVSDTNTGTIVFRNMIGEFPDDGSTFITSGTGVNNLRNLKIEFYMKENGKKFFKRRVVFDRLKKAILPESCKVGTGADLEDCDTGKKWVKGF
ncbi:type II secretion system GspH family protein [Candidatus Gracilibacteria bacterium]|nr:type II secretion system GspH family protein [Candidatus Gracilibacteria bacterium]